MLWLLLILAPFSASFGQVRWQEHVVPLGAPIAGAAADPDNSSRAYVWGSGVLRVDLIAGQPHRLAAKGKFMAPGCPFQGGLALLEAPDRLVWAHGERLETRTPIDTEADFADCVDLTLFGRRGLMITNRGLQVRFYEPAAGTWPYREIYSFYTASYQSGLIQASIDSDKHPDLFSGNYWIQSPSAFDLPWRLFAINTYNELPHSAHMRIARIRRAGRSASSLVVAQGELHPARLAVFDPPADIRKLWIETRIGGELSLHHPRTLAVADFDRDGREDFVLAESEGPRPRVWWWRQQPDGNFLPTLMTEGFPAKTGWISDVDRDGRPDVVLVEEARIRWLGNQPLK